jgi:hypothetical protein
LPVLALLGETWLESNKPLGYRPWVSKDTAFISLGTSQEIIRMALTLTSSER